MIHRSPVRAIHQIEITSRCNLRCKYCASPYLARPKMDMSEAHYRRALELVLECRDEYGQRSLNLAGIGESTMHPQFIDFVRLAREELGEGFDLVLATNGLLVDDAMAQALLPYHPRIFVSMHRPERAKFAIDALDAVGLLVGISQDPAIASTDWAGQVDWKVTAGLRFVDRTCEWVRGGWSMVMADGRVTTCSFDASGIGVVGHVNDPLESLYVSPYTLCHTCDQNVGYPLDEVPKHASLPLNLKERAGTIAALKPLNVKVRVEAA